MAKRSIVWNYFFKESKEISRCKMCDKVVRTSSNTSNLLTHLKVKHPEIDIPRANQKNLILLRSSAKNIASTENSNTTLGNQCFSKIISTPIPSCSNVMNCGDDNFNKNSLDIELSFTENPAPTREVILSRTFDCKLAPICVEQNQMTSKQAVHPSKLRVGFIGAGNIAIALARGFIDSGYLKANQIYVSAPSLNNSSNFKDLGCHVTNDNSKLFFNQNENRNTKSDFVFIVFLCVKPMLPKKQKDFFKFLTNPGFVSNGSPVYIVSVLAGVTLSSLKSFIDKMGNLPVTYHLARIMPNTACGSCSGTIGLSFYESNRSIYTDLIQLLDILGTCEILNEDQLDAVVGVAGSGIAFVYSMIQAMADGGVLMGLPSNVALNLAVQTVAGAAEMVRKTGKSPSELRSNVCSPGGTTITGVYALEVGSFNATVMSAVEASTKKSLEFSQLFNSDN